MTISELSEGIEKRREEIARIQKNQRSMRGKAGQRAQQRLAMLQHEADFMLAAYNEALAGAQAPA